MPRKYNIQCKGLNNNMIIHPFFTFFYKHSLICHLLQSPTFLQSSYLFSKHWFNTFENGLIFISKMVLNYISLYIYQCKPCQGGGAFCFCTVLSVAAGTAATCGRTRNFLPRWIYKTASRIHTVFQILITKIMS